MVGVAALRMVPQVCGATLEVTVMISAKWAG
jgi:hypothetical protein